LIVGYSVILHDLFFLLSVKVKYYGKIIGSLHLLIIGQDWGHLIKICPRLFQVKEREECWKFCQLRLGSEFRFRSATKFEFRFSTLKCQLVVTLRIGTYVIGQVVKSGSRV
jgi:hypothetical protein